MSAASSGEKNGPRHALRDGPAEEPGRPRHGQQRGDRSTTRRLAEDRHPVRVAAEGPDVVAHPLQRGDLVEQAPVGGGAVDLRETLYAQPVVERHHDDAAGGQPAAVVLRKAGLRRSRSRRRGSTPAPAGRHPGPGSGDQTLTVSQSSPSVRRRVSPNMPGCGGGGPYETAARTPAQPLRRPRCGESERTDRRLGVRDAAEDRQPRLPAAAQHPGRRADLGPGGGLGRWGGSHGHDG